MASVKPKSTFDTSNLPEKATPIYDVDGVRMGTFNPHTHVIHPTADSDYGPVKVLGTMVFNNNGQMVGTFNEDGLFQPA